MEVLPFAGFQVLQKAKNDLRHLITESKWRKLQKHFSISICFSCCHCQLVLCDLELLYDHFSTVHQVDLSYIETLLKKSEEGNTDAETKNFILSENLIEDLVQLGKSIETVQQKSEDDNEKMKDVKNVRPKTDDVKSDTPKRKGRPKKKTLEHKTKDSVVQEEIKVKTEERPKENVAKRTRRAVKQPMEVANCDTKVNSKKKIGDKTSTPRSVSKIEKPVESDDKPTDDSTDTLLFEDENSIEDISELIEEEEIKDNPSVDANSRQVLKRSVGRNVDSEEIKAKTCAICKEIQPSIKDCFTHYESVHDYVPKSVYETPPVDSKFEQNRSKKDRKSKGRSKTDVNAEQCRFCGKMFLKDNIDKHIHLRHYWLRIERKEKRRQNVVCHLCGKLYHHKQNLEAHIAAAHRGKPRRKPIKSSATPRVHICQTCGYTTPEIRRLKNHIAAHHEGVMPYKCDHCSFQTWEPSSWRCHKQRHSEEKKYKCTECSYQCIQRKQLRRHMNVKHQTVLPKKWKRKDEDAPATLSKLLPSSSETVNVCQNKESDVPSLIEHMQYEVSNSMQGNVQYVQLAPTVEVSSLQQSGLNTLSGDIIPTEIVITVANTSDYSNNKALTSVANSQSASSHLSRENLIVIPPSTNSFRDVPHATQQLVLATRLDEEEGHPAAVQEDIPKRMYYRPHFPLLQGIIQHQPGGPVLQTNKDGSVIFIQKTSNVEASSSLGSLSVTEENYVLPDNNAQQPQTEISEEQQVVYLDSESETVYSGNSTTVSTIDLRQASELTDLLPESAQNAQNMATNSLKGVRSSENVAIATDGSERKTLEQDIAQTLIQINPPSRLSKIKSRKN